MKGIQFKVAFFCFVLLLFINTLLFAGVKLPALFSDNMVLQQNANVAVWGWADPGEQIEISNTWNKKATRLKADPDGKWITRIRTSGAGGPYTLTIKGKNKIELKNVLLGEVWLCSGQSNMEFPLQKEQSWKTGDANGAGEIAQANYPDLRMFIVERKTSEKPLNNAGGSWYVSDSAIAGKFSAVAYYFGKEIMKKAGVPVGLIHSSWGGTPADAWTPNEFLSSDADYKPIFGRYNKAVADYGKASQLYADSLTQWLKDSAAAVQKQEKIPVAPRKPAAIRFHQSPSQLYNAMIAPLVPYTLKGVIWYQGESNAGRAYQYRKLFPALINSWRKDWKTDFSFYFVQIAPYKDQNPEIREAQLLTYRSEPKTGIVVITDAGDSADIHPRNKSVPGKRLALWALAKDYGKKDIVYSGPLYKSMKKEGNKIRIEFDFADGGLVAANGSLKEFTIAGDDKKFIPASAVIEGNTVIVWSDAVAAPASVRYSWKNVPHPDLYNKAGLPASPFRTDDWPGETVGKN